MLRYAIYFAPTVLLVACFLLSLIVPAQIW